MTYVKDGKYPVFGSGDKPTGFADTYNNEGNITIAREGTVGKVYHRKFKHFVIKTSFIVKPTSDKLRDDFLYHWLLSKEPLIQQLKYKMVPVLDVEKFLKLIIYIPSVEVQKYVVDRLDRYKDLLDRHNQVSRQLIKEINALLYG